MFLTDAVETNERIVESLADSRDCSRTSATVDLDALDALDSRAPPGLRQRLKLQRRNYGESEPMLDPPAVARSLTAADSRSTSQPVRSSQRWSTTHR